MDNEKKYGYLRLDEESHQNVMRAPNLGPEIPQTGYNFQATNYLCCKIASQTEDCGFVDTSKVLNTEIKLNALEYVLDEALHKNLMIGDIPVNPSAGQFSLLNDIMDTAKIPLGYPNKPKQRFVATLTISSPSKEPHGVALCIDADKEKNTLNIMLLEQHARRDGGHLDFSKESKEILNNLESVFNDLGMEIHTFQNEKPICREKGVCGIVSLEVCRRLLQAEDPMKISQLGLIKINAEQVQKLHQTNFQNWEKDKPTATQPLSRSPVKTYE